MSGIDLKIEGGQEIHNLDLSFMGPTGYHWQPRSLLRASGSNPRVRQNRLLTDLTPTHVQTKIWSVRLLPLSPILIALGIIL